MAEIVDVIFMYGSNSFKKEVAQFILDNDTMKTQFLNSNEFKELARTRPSLSADIFAAYSSNN